MLATLAEPPLTGKGLVYEPKYDGIRALVHVGPDVRIWSRLGNEKTSQFPSVVRALAPLAAQVRAPLLLDGELVALRDDGRPAGFQRLQGRIHLTGSREVDALDRSQPVALILFDLLRDGDEDVRGVPLMDRRARLERLVAGALSDTVRLSEQVADDGRALHARAREEGWEGLIVKDARSPYHAGRRAPAWRKLKLQNEQEFIIGGWTEPRQTRQYFGALLLGEYVEATNALRYVGHTGTGFDQAELARVWKLLRAREIDRSPFAERFKTNEPAHWVRPELVAQVRFTEWTADHKLRHPVYLGLRDDKRAADVKSEVKSESGGGILQPRQSFDAAQGRAPGVGRGRTREAQAMGVGPHGSKESAPRAAPAARASGRREAARSAAREREARGESLQPRRGRTREAQAMGVGPHGSRESAPRAAPAARASGRREAARSAAREREARGGGAPRALRKDSTILASTTSNVVAQLRALEDVRRDGTIELPGGERLAVTNLAKVFWPGPQLTKGDLLRYYAQVAPFLLPAVADRPLVMKRFPNGVDKPAFYQQRSRLEKPPPGVRIETLARDLDPISEPDARRFVGGSLITLLYMAQIAAISQDPWFSRVQSPLDADYVAIDLDPGEGTPFSRVLDVARYVRDELLSLDVPAVAKTSGSSGVHISIPLPPGTSYESGMLFCQIVATVIAARHPKLATVERAVRARRLGTVYVDYLQNILGKTLATAYSARASAFAGVSTPLTWKELDDPIDPRDFTIVTAPERFRRAGDLWAPLRSGRTADLESVFRKYQRRGTQG